MYRLMHGAETGVEEDSAAELMADGLAAIGDAIQAELGALLVLDEPSGELQFALTYGGISREQLEWVRVPKGAGIAQWVLSQKKPVTINDAHTDERFYDKVDQYTGLRTRSVVAAPIHHAGKAFGALEFLNKRAGRLFTLSDQNRLCLMSHFFAMLMCGILSER